MLFYIILKHPKGVWENVFPTNILFFYFFIVCKIIFKADVMPFLTDVMLADVIAMC